MSEYLYPHFRSLFGGSFFWISGSITKHNGRNEWIARNLSKVDRQSGCSKTDAAPERIRRQTLAPERHPNATRTPPERLLNAVRTPPSSFGCLPDGLLHPTFAPAKRKTRGTNPQKQPRGRRGRQRKIILISETFPLMRDAFFAKRKHPIELLYTFVLRGGVSPGE